MRLPLIVGNWKMNKKIGEALQHLTDLRKLLEGVHDVDVVVAPSFTALGVVKGILSDDRIGLAAQDVHWEEEGAFTGAVSVSQILDLGCRYVIVGHSERRQQFGDTSESVRKKASVALRHGLHPIVCVGEALDEREQGRTEAIVESQMAKSLAGFSSEEARKCVIAYEPVWAIGTGRTATPRQAGEVHRFIRGYLTKTWGSEASRAVRILYGGSVTPGNIAGLMREREIDGVLVGGASLDPEAFADIVRQASKAKLPHPNPLPQGEGMG